MRFNRKTFFDGYRQAFDKLNEKQVSGLEFLLGAIESDPLWNSIQQVSYVLATVYHETARTFQPITEYRSREGTKARANQDRYWEPYRGRGFIQLTWKRNYEKFGIADNPEKALEPETAYRILSEGMRKGIFTGKKLSNYINDSEVDYVQARRIVNGLDRANDIAEIARKFERVLKASLLRDIVVEDKRAKPEPSVTQSVTETKDSLPTQPPTVNVEHADQVQASTQTPIPGGHKDDTPIQATQGGNKSMLATIFGGIGGAVAAVAGWFQNNGSLAMIGIICLTIVLLAFIFRQLIIDYFRMKYVSDPNRINVK